MNGMLAIKHILFPVDFSEQNAAAAPFVRAMAAQFGAEVTLISVLPPFWEPVGGMLVPGAPMPMDLESLRSNLAHRLAGAFVTELAGVTVRRVAELGDPAQVVTQYAQSEGVDLIMMPTHGVSGYRRELLGSVTAQVLHEAKCPVWTTAHSERQQSPQIPRIILCAIDDSAATAAIMRWASDFSACVSAELTFLHVVALVGSATTSPGDSGIQEELRKGTYEKLESLRQESGLGGRLQVIVGDVVETVIRGAHKEHADLLIIGRGHVPSPLGRLRSKAYAMIQESACPVLSVAAQV